MSNARSAIVTTLYNTVTQPVVNCDSKIEELKTETTQQNMHLYWFIVHVPTLKQLHVLHWEKKRKKKKRKLITDA